MCNQRDKRDDQTTQQGLHEKPEFEKAELQSPTGSASFRCNLETYVDSNDGAHLAFKNMGI